MTLDCGTGWSRKQHTQTDRFQRASTGSIQPTRILSKCQTVRPCPSAAPKLAHPGIHSDGICFCIIGKGQGAWRSSSAHTSKAEMWGDCTPSCNPHAWERLSLAHPRPSPTIIIVNLAACLSWLCLVRVGRRVGVGVSLMMSSIPEPFTREACNSPLCAHL